jgi:EmrB/QacA subfamily drug resistance transporter
LDPKRWVALIVVLVAGFMDLLDVTIVNVAVPSILRDLHADYSQIEWIVAAYVLGFAAVLITGGRLGDTFGRKRLFLVGVTGFTVASLICGLATSPGVLVAARFLEGAMAGLMVPQILSIIHVTFPAKERGKVFGIWGGVLGSASAAGLVIGGLLLRWNPDGLEWRPIFLVNVPVGLVAILAGSLYVREPRSPTASRVDLVGMVLAVAAVLLLVYPLTEGRSLGWPWWTFALMGASAVVLAVFVVFEARRTRRLGSPLVVLSLFTKRAFTAGMIVWQIFWVALGGFFLVWTLYLQVGLGWSPLRAGLTAVAFAGGAAVGAGMSVQVLTPRFGRSVLMAGALLNALGFAAYALVLSHESATIQPWQMIAPLLVAGYGFGLVVAPMVDAILTGVPVADAGSGSGQLSTMQQVGIALGVALVGVLFFNLLANHANAGVNAAAPELRQGLVSAGISAQHASAILARFRECVDERSAAKDPTEVPASCRATQRGPTGARVQTLLSEAERTANAHNFAREFSVTLWYAVGMLAVVFCGVFALPRRVRLHSVEGEPQPAPA